MATTNFIDRQTLITADWLNDVDAQVYGQDSGSFTGTLTGCTTSPTTTVYWIRQGNIVTLDVQGIVGTSNTTSASLTGMPSSLYPARTQIIPGRYQDNSVDAIGLWVITTSGVIDLYNAAGSSTFFTASGGKGILTCTVTYRLN